MRNIIVFIASLCIAAVVFTAAEKPRAKWISRPSVIVDPQPQPIQSPVPPKPSWSPSAIGLIASGNKYPGANVCKSEPNAILMAMAERHAKYQASICKQGHQNFDKRCAELRQTFGNFEYAEICAESWPKQANQSMEALGWEMFKCWRQSPGHWSVACKRHRYFGASMAQGRNGIWYACIIVADGGIRSPDFNPKYKQEKSDMTWNPPPMIIPPTSQADVGMHPLMHVDGIYDTL